MEKSKRLTPQQQEFVYALAADPKACQSAAALKAGYSKKSARKTASDLMTSPNYAHVRAAYQALVDQRLARYGVTEDWIIARLAYIADADPHRIATTPPEELFPEVVAVQRFKKIALNDGSGRVVIDPVLCDRMAALTLLAKIKGMITNKHEVKFDVTLAAEREAEESFMTRLAKLAESQKTKELLADPGANVSAN